MTIIAISVAFLGILVLLIAAYGVVRLPDALARQHAVTKAGTIGISLFALGLMLFAFSQDWETGWLLRLILLMLVLFLVMPLASHALARASSIENNSQ